MKVKDIAKAVQQGFSQVAKPAEPAKPVEAVAPPAAQNDTPSVEQKNDVVLPAPTPHLNPRNRAFAEIAKRSNAQTEADAKETVPVMDEDRNIIEPAPAAAEEPASEPAAEPAAAEEVAAPAAEAPVAEAPAEEPAPQSGGGKIDPNAEYEFIVDGVPTRFKGSQVLSYVQKGGAADYRLQLATSALELSRQQRPQDAATPQGASQPAGAAAPTTETTLSDQELAEMVQFGKPEQAAKAIAEIRKRAPDAVTAKGMQEFMQAQLPRIVSNEISFREATRFAQQEYGDLLADPYLGPLFHAEEDKRRAAGNAKPYADLYREIGDDLRKHFNRPKPMAKTTPAPTASQAAAAPTMAQRQAAKAAAPAAPRLASARLDGGAQQPKPKTREEIIRGMQESRGQRPVTNRA